MRSWLAQHGYDEGSACSSLPHGSMGSGSTTGSGMMSHGHMSEGSAMSDHTADDAACGIPFRIADDMPSRLKFGVSVGDGSRRERRKLMDMAHGGDMFGCGDKSCMSTRCLIHVSFARARPRPSCAPRH